MSAGCFECLRPTKTEGTAASNSSTRGVASDEVSASPVKKASVAPHPRIDVTVNSVRGKTFTSSELQEDFYRTANAYVATEHEVTALRQKEYPLLDQNSIVYLDYTGSGLASSRQVTDHMAALQSTILGNPHSAGDTPSPSQQFVDSARAEVLSFFKAQAGEYQVIFTNNATGALKLVGESFPFRTGSTFLISADNHNSVNGIESYCTPKGAKTKRIPLRGCQLDDAALRKMLTERRKAPSLFAYPAQSNLTGVQHSLEWVEIAQKAGWVVLLDIAAYCPTNTLDLSKIQPDFCSVSCYKMFGYPTGVGCLLVRKSALKLIAQRPWFAGGTVQMVYPDGRPMMMPEDEPDRWEDGTVAFSAMAAVPIGLRHLEKVGVHNISKRSKCLAGWTMGKMLELRHPNGSPLCIIHGPTDMRGRGGTICFNLLNEQGALMSVTQISGLAETAGIMIRAGCMCNPHGAWHALSAFNVQQLRGWDPDLLPGKAPTDQVPMKQLVASVEKHSEDCGCCRISFGIVSTFGDAQAAVEFLQSFIMSGPTGPASPIRTVATQNLAWLKSIAPNGLSKHKSIIPQGLLGLEPALSFKAVLVDLSVPA